MNPRKPPATTNVTGGTFIGSAIGQGNTVSNNIITVGDVSVPATLDVLRTAIDAARDELVRTAGNPDAQAEVRYELRKIEQELDEQEPQGAVVRSRWEQVAMVLSPLAAASGAIAQITDLITKVFGES